MRLGRFLLILFVPVLLVGVGTVGYQLIEGWPLFDSFYMAVITLTTVGFLEVHPMSQAGRGFTAFLALGGIFTLFSAATTVIGLIVSGRVGRLLGRQRMERTLSELKQHVIICGYGRMGRNVAREFQQMKVPFVVIDRDEKAMEDIQATGGLALHGDATSDELLKKAGIARARALVSVVASDSDNLYITMSARLIAEKIFIVARAENEAAEGKLIRAGASRVVAPYVLGGSHVAQAVVRPTVVDFIELATRSEHIDLNMEELHVEPGSALDGQTLKDSRIRDEHGVIIVGIKKPTGKMVFNPPPDVKLEAGDILIALGMAEGMRRLEFRASTKKT